MRIIVAAGTALALLVGAGSAGAAGKTVLTHEALWTMKRVGEPAVSPDGKVGRRLQVVEPSYESDKRSATFGWSRPTARLSRGGSPIPRRPRTVSPGRPTAASIAFATKRDGDEVEQIYVLDLAAGGEARRVTNVSTGAG